MKRLYRFAGISVRWIQGPNERLCCVVELQHTVSGELYHHHKDFPVPKGPKKYLDALFAGFEVAKICDGKTVNGWALKERPLQESEAEALVKLAEEIRQFIGWLTPCGMCEAPPPPNIIGEAARALYAKLR